MILLLYKYQIRPVNAQICLFLNNTPLNQEKRQIIGISKFIRSSAVLTAGKWQR